MDPHPTPFPGKRRTWAKNTVKEKGDGKRPGEAAHLTTVASRHRGNRVFGTVRSTNTVMERPSKESTQASKQLKPSGASKKLPARAKAVPATEPKKSSPATGGGSCKDAVRRPNAGNQASRVHFEGQRQPAKAVTGKDIGDEGPRTPLSAVKPMAVAGTPYLSAITCSKCKFDRLESAPYWLAQIKLAESVGKHFASAAFFRLALECDAEPIRNLKSELKRYMARHSSLHILAGWREVSHDYGLLNQDLSLGMARLDAAAPSAVVKQDPPTPDQQGVDRDGGSVCEYGSDSMQQTQLPKEDSTKDLDSYISEGNSNLGENRRAVVSGDRSIAGIGAAIELNSDVAEMAGTSIMVTKESADEGNSTVLMSGNADTSVTATPREKKSDEGSCHSPDNSSPLSNSKPIKSAEGCKTKTGRSQATSGPGKKELAKAAMLKLKGTNSSKREVEGTRVVNSRAQPMPARVVSKSQVS